MRHALLITAYDRVDLLRPVLSSWREVAELPDWRVRVAVEPSPVQDRVVALAAELPGAEVVVNERRLGVAENPYRHLGELFDGDADFVVRAEDDLLVADDVLRLLAWTAEAYAADPAVAVACAFSRAPAGADPALLHRTPAFVPWVWGTWAERWADLIGPTWDRDHSTWNGSPGVESGWDWNLNTRVLPAHGLTTVAPLASRVQNIGVVGQHGTAENHETAASFLPRFGSPEYREAPPDQVQEPDQVQ